jgi:hypothetical protein
VNYWRRDILTPMNYRSGLGSRFLYGASLLLVMASVMISQTQPMVSAAAWQSVIKGPLSAPNGEEYFASALKDELAPILQGVLVSITPETIGVRRLLVAMESTDKVDVTIMLRGQMAKLKTEPKKGTLVRFRGVVQKFTKEPFTVTFLTNRRGSFVDFVESR